MRMFVASGDTADFAHFRVRVEIKNYLNSIRSIPGLYATTYLGPEISSPTGINTGTTDGLPRLTVNSDKNDLTNRATILFAFAGVAFISSIGLAVWFRLSHRHLPRHTTTTTNNNSHTNIKEDEPREILRVDTKESVSFEDDNDPLSPFSKMLPAAYRLDDDQADMSVILELNESLNDRGSSILISEGYTTDDGESLDLDASLNFSQYSSAPVLGATRRGEIQSLVDV